MTPEEDMLLRRLVISSRDLADATAFFRLLKHRGEAPDGAFTEEDNIRLALTIAGVVAYARPFKTSYGAGTKSKLTIDDLALAPLPSLDPAQVALHDELIAERDRICAHSDADLWGYQMVADAEYGSVPTVAVPRKRFEGEYLTRVVSLCNVIHVKIGLAAKALNPSGVIQSSYLPPRAS